MLYRVFSIHIGLLLAVLVACAPISAEYSVQAYRNATDLKARSAALIAQSAEPYARHAAEAEALLLDIDKAYEFAAGLPRNEPSARQWALLRDPDRNFVAGFIDFWRDAGSRGVGKTFRDEFATAAARQFDYLICLESTKRDGSCDTLGEGS